MVSAQIINDRTIVTLIRKGDHSVCKVVYDKYAPLLYGIIYRIVKDQTVAENLLEDTIAKVWKDQVSYDPEKLSLCTWMMNIARNLAINKTHDREDPAKIAGPLNLLDLVLKNGMNIDQAAACKSISVTDALRKFREELKTSIAHKP
ncbi:MAG: sigma factor [Daejeonella sp.]